MKAALLFGPHDIRVTTVPDPTPGDEEVVVKTSFCGLCGTDLHGWEGWTSSSTTAAAVPGAAGSERPVNGASEPRNLGHEISGVVVALGNGVTSVKLGD